MTEINFDSEDLKESMQNEWFYKDLKDLNLFFENSSKQINSKKITAAPKSVVIFYESENGQVPIFFGFT
jgi:hypothetical protein